MRQRPEDLYAGVEHMVGKDAAESIKIITRMGTERIARFAFGHARTFGRKRVTAIHKANIMKLGDGLFLESVRTVSRDYSDIAYDEKIEVAGRRLMIVPSKTTRVLPSRLRIDTATRSSVSWTSNSAR